MTNDRFLPFAFPAVASKKITAAFDGGRITSDGGVMVLAQAERRLAIAEKLAAVIADPRDPLRLVHRLPQILRARILAIACGYEDANDLDRLRFDPAFKLACGRLPDSGLDLCSQPTMSRWENAPNLREVIRLMGVMIDLYCASYATPPVAVTLDRHARRGARPSTAVAVQCPLRRALLSAHPCLRRRDQQAAGGAAAPRQDAVRSGGHWPFAPARTPHPPALADYQNHPAWR
jgi:hypothetical protein